MFRFFFVFLFAIIFTSNAFSQERLATQFEIQKDLFGSTKLNDDSGLNFPMQESGGGKKSPALAAIFSLVLPGLGEHYAEGFGSGKYFSIAEGALWLTYASFDVYGNSLRDDARSFAIAHAGINSAGKDDDFYVDIGNFLNTEEFNDKRLRERSPERVYDANAGEGWRWDSDASRAQYKDVRLSGENVLNNRKFVVTAIIINHIASAINAARVAISHNKELSNPMGELQFKAEVMGGPENAHGVMLTISKGF